MTNPPPPRPMPAERETAELCLCGHAEDDHTQNRMKDTSMFGKTKTGCTTCLCRSFRVERPMPAERAMLTDDEIDALTLLVNEAARRRGSWDENVERARAGLARLRALAETLGRYEDARDHYQAVQRRGHSPYIRENGRQGGSPWAELMDAIDAALAGGTEGR